MPEGTGGRRTRGQDEVAAFGVQEAAPLGDDREPQRRIRGGGHRTRPILRIERPGRRSGQLDEMVAVDLPVSRPEHVSIPPESRLHRKTADAAEVLDLRRVEPIEPVQAGALLPMVGQLVEQGLLDLTGPVEGLGRRRHGEERSVPEMHEALAVEGTLAAAEVERLVQGRERRLARAEQEDARVQRIRLGLAMHEQHGARPVLPRDLLPEALGIAAELDSLHRRFGHTDAESARVRGPRKGASTGVPPPRTSVVSGAGRATSLGARRGGGRLRLFRRPDVG